MIAPSLHTCDTSAGDCADATRDWCPNCEACVVYDGELCQTCGREWGDGA